MESIQKHNAQLSHLKENRAMINMKEIINGQEEAKAPSFNTDLFKSDIEYQTEEFSISPYSGIVQLETAKEETRKEGSQTYNVMIDSFVGIIDEDAFLVTVTQSKFNGETRIDWTTKELTLQGYNWFTKDSEPNVDYYNLLLNNAGYEITIDDILSMGELNTDYNNTTLKFKHNDKMHYLTVNKYGQLSKITVKEPQETTAQAKDKSLEDKEKLQSIFG